MLENLLLGQSLGDPLFNPLKYAIRAAYYSEVSLETIVLLLLLPLVTLIIAAFRHLMGLRGFGIFLPASLAVVFLAIGPTLGLGLFLVIVLASTFFRTTLRKLKIKLAYLPRMSLILWAVTLCVFAALFGAHFISTLGVSGVSIFPILILILLAEEFTRVQLGKSAEVAMTLTGETLVLGLVSWAVLALPQVQSFALLNPETTLLSVLALDLFLGRYTGLRLAELWRFRKLLRK
ncbi:MAG: 7TM domain-containing protein [Patescibacteria group bacterium]